MFLNYRPSSATSATTSSQPLPNLPNLPNLPSLHNLHKDSGINPNNLHQDLHTGLDLQDPAKDLQSQGSDPDSTFCGFYNPDFIIYSSLGSFYIPCIVMVVLYSKIFKVITKVAYEVVTLGILTKYPPVYS